MKKQLTVQSGDGEIFTFDVPELFDRLPPEFKTAALQMDRNDRNRLAEALLQLFLLPDEELDDPAPEVIDAAAQRGFEALNRLQSR